MRSAQPHKLIPLLCAVAVAAMPASAAPPEYVLQPLGDATLITGMNESAEVVGWDIVGSQLRGFVAGPTHPYELLPLPGGYTSSWAKDINDAGVVVGSVGAGTYPELGDGIAWIPDGQGGYDMQLLGNLPGHTGSVATAINNRGDIVGTSIFNNSGFGPTVWFNAPGGIMDLQALGAPNMPTALNENGLVVGFAAPPFDIDTLQSVPFAPGMLGGTAVMAVNNNDDLAGYAIPSCQCSRFAVRYTGQFGWEQLGGVGGTSAQISAYGINDNGVTVMETYAPYPLGHHVAVHFDEYGTLALSSLLAADQGNWSFCACQGEALNNAGQIAVNAENLDTFESGVVLLTPVAQPNPADLDGDGVVGVPDFLELLAAWGPCDDCGDCPADLDGDCAVGVTDFLILLASWS